MKIIPKKTLDEHNILETNLVQAIKDNSFLTKIFEVKQYGDNVYLIMEYFIKGDLYFYTRKEGKDKVQFSDEALQGVLAEIVVAMEFLHSQGVVYRNLKPENILITDDGHIKLTDYVLSKNMEGESKKGVYTFKGSIQYMAPQIIKGPFGHKADVWALGIVAYEMKFRQNPLQNNGKVQYSFSQYEQLLKNNFIDEKLNSKIGYMSQQFRQLLRKLLEQDPENRISLEELHSHPYFQKINWEKVKARMNVPPLGDMIKENNSFKFRDFTRESSRRGSVVKRHKSGEKQQFKFDLKEV